jgi:hypothetical protein
MLPLFADEDDCETRGHQWVKGTYIWPHDPTKAVRLVWICTRCGEKRGRA